MYFCVKLSLSTLPFLLHWLRWPCLWVLIVSFWGLKDARWALDVLKRQTAKPVCEWKITSLAFLWLEKTLNKLSMCSTARWRVHWLCGCIWIALRDAAQCVQPWLYVCVCVCARMFSKELFLFSAQSTWRSSLWQDRGRSALTYRTTHLRKNTPLSTSPSSLSCLSTSLLFFPLTFTVSDPDGSPPSHWAHSSLSSFLF